MRYQDSYVFKDVDFAMLLFDISHFHLFTKNYGREWSNHLLGHLVEKIQEIVGVEGVCGRINGDHFLVVHQVKDHREVEETVKAVVRGVEEIREVDGIPCTVYLNVG